LKRKKRIKILKGLHIGKRLIKWSKKREYYNIFRKTTPIIQRVARINWFLDVLN